HGIARRGRDRLVEAARREPLPLLARAVEQPGERAPRELGVALLVRGDARVEALERRIAGLVGERERERERLGHAERLADAALEDERGEELTPVCSDRQRT